MSVVNVEVHPEHMLRIASRYNLVLVSIDKNIDKGGLGKILVCKEGYINAQADDAV